MNNQRIITACGSSALYANTLGNYNVGIGGQANYYNESGTKNTIIGYQAGRANAAHNKSGNVFLCYQAGYSELGDNKLYIENSNSSSPLIWGDFTNDIAAINGKLGVGTQNPTDNLTIVTAVGGEDAFRIKFSGATKFRVAANGGTAIGVNANPPSNGLYVHGNIENQGGVLHTSDRRFKKNIINIPNALDKLNKINGVFYYWKTKEFPKRNFSNDKQIGVIAQDVEKVFPELVNTDSDSYKSVNYSKLTPILIEAVKEQQESIKNQEERIKTLEKENEKIRIDNAKLTSVIKEMSEMKEVINKLVKQQIKLSNK